MKLNLLLIGGLFFLVGGLLAIVIMVLRDIPSGLIVDAGQLGGAALGSLFCILVGVFLMHLGTRPGRFSKKLGRH